MREPKAKTNPISNAIKTHDTIKYVSVDSLKNDNKLININDISICISSSKLVIRKEAWRLIESICLDIDKHLTDESPMVYNLNVEFKCNHCFPP
jgi:hypothetical protein